MLSNPLQEMQEIGAEIRSTAQQELPTLLKYARENRFLKDIEEYTANRASRLFAPCQIECSENQVVLEEFDNQGLDKVLTALLYPRTSLSRKEVFKTISSLSRKNKESILNQMMIKRGLKDSVPRAFEAIDYVFDILVDYGAYRDIQRHRMLTPFPQLLTVRNGYSTPQEIALAGLSSEYTAAMEETARTIEKIGSDFPQESQYLIPLAYRIRVLQKMNLREVFQFTELRSGKKGHSSYRKIAQQMADEVIKVHPELGCHLKIDRSE